MDNKTRGAEEEKRGGIKKEGGHEKSPEPHENPELAAFQDAERQRLFGGNGNGVAKGVQLSPEGLSSNGFLKDAMRRMISGLYIPQLQSYNGKPLYHNVHAHADAQYLGRTKQGAWAFGGTRTPGEQTDGGLWAWSSKDAQECPTSCAEWRISGTWLEAQGITGNADQAVCIQLILVDAPPCQPLIQASAGAGGGCAGSACASENNERRAAKGMQPAATSADAPGSSCLHQKDGVLESSSRVKPRCPAYLCGVLTDLLCMRGGCTVCGAFTL